MIKGEGNKFDNGGFGIVLGEISSVIMEEGNKGEDNCLVQRDGSNEEGLECIQFGARTSSGLELRVLLHFQVPFICFYPLY